MGVVISFKVRGQRLERTNTARPVAGSKRGYVTCRFDMDEEWGSAKVAVSFFDKGGTEHAMLMSQEGTCPVPDAVTDGNLFRVQLTGDFGGSRASTNKVAVIQEVL